MKKEWNDIKKQIQAAQEPLNEDAWSQLEALLPSKPKGPQAWPFLLAFLFLISTGFGIGFWEQSRPSDFSPQMPDKKPAIENVASPKSSTSVKEKEPIKVSKQHKINPSGSEASKLSNTPRPFTNGAKSDTKVYTAKSFNQESLVSKLQQRDTRKSKRIGEHNDEALSLILPQKALYEESIFQAIQSWALKLPTDSMMNEAGQNPALNTSKHLAVPPSGLEVKMSLGSTYNLSPEEYTPTANQTHRGFSNAAKDAVSPALGLQASVELKYRLFKNLKVGGGFGFERIVTQNQYNYEVTEIPVIDGASGNIIAYIPLNETRKVEQADFNNFQLLSFPVSAYNEWPLSPKWLLTGEFTHHFGILLHQKSKTLNPLTLELEDRATNTLHKYPMAYQLRLGLQYEVSSIFSLALEPSYRSYYGNLFTGNNIQWQPANLSLNLSAILRWNSIKTRKR